MHLYPQRVSLEGLECEIFKLVSYAATAEQWREWLRVPLEHAAARGNLDLFNALLGAGASGSAGWRGCRGRTLIDAAALGGSVDVVSTLLRVGARPDVAVVSSSSGRSALYTATMCGHEAVARRLIVAGADVNFQDPVRKRPALHEAIEGGHEQIVSDLVIGGASLNAREDCDGGAFPLHFAAAKGFDGMVSTLLLRGADKDALDNDCYDETPLMWASNSGHLAVVETLLAAGADFNIRNTEDESSALDCAANKGHVDVLKAILGHGADVNAHDDDGYTALHVAAWSDKVDVIDTLIEEGADIELKRGDGHTAIFSAARNNCCNALLTLCRRGATVTARANDGCTPLHEACRRWHGEYMEATVGLLLRWGADETALNNEGQTPADLLDMENENAVNHPTQDEIECTRLLLSRAPADRMWRRRCWLVILRSRAEKARRASSCDSGGEIRDGPPGRGVDHVVRRRQANTGVGVGGADGECGVLSVVGALLVGLEPEGVFRTVVGFL